MAWYSRIASAISRTASAVARIFRGPAPQPVLVPEEPPPVPPREPIPDYRDWFEDIPTEEPTEEPWGGPFPPGEEPEWFGNEAPPLTDDYGEIIDTGKPMTVQDWLDEALRPNDYLLDKYGISNIDIMQQLYDWGEIGEEEWDVWRATYEYLYG